MRYKQTNELGQLAQVEQLDNTKRIQETQEIQRITNNRTIGATLKHRTNTRNATSQNESIRLDQLQQLANLEQIQ